ncbi:hypothetical protein [Streptomyces sp. NPDC059564]|uniref:hypothetical protein n=1 Tax=Streptomyces sp. NPDC059564 TaxID=3346865 RepID=UPI0036BBE930
MDTDERFAYLRDLPGAEGLKHGLYVFYDGVHFSPEPEQRPCEPQKMSVTQFWVVMKAEVNRDPVTRRTYAFSYRYELIEDRELSVGPERGHVEGSDPPAPTGCKGTITVLHLGDAVDEDALPRDLSFQNSDGVGFAKDMTSVKVSGDLVLEAQFVPPRAPQLCKA